MLVDHTNGKLFGVLAEIEQEDAKLGVDHEPKRGKLLASLVRQLAYLDRYATDVDPAPENHDEKCARHVWFKGLSDEASDRWFDVSVAGKIPDCTCGAKRIDPTNCLVSISRDSCKWSFSLLWLLKKKDADPYCACKYNQSKSFAYPTDCKCYKAWFNGGLIYHESDCSWSVHT